MNTLAMQQFDNPPTFNGVNTPGFSDDQYALLNAAFLDLKDIYKPAGLCMMKELNRQSWIDAYYCQTLARVQDLLITRLTELQSEATQAALVAHVRQAICK